MPAIFWGLIRLGACGVVLQVGGESADIDISAWVRPISELGVSGALLLVIWSLLTGRLYTPQYVKLMASVTADLKDQLSRCREMDRGRSQDWQHTASAADSTIAEYKDLVDRLMSENSQLRVKTRGGANP